MPTGKSLIFRIFLVRDQEVGGSNPLAPTTLFSARYILRPSEKVVVANKGTKGARTSAEPHPVEPFVISLLPKRWTSDPAISCVSGR